MAKAKYDWGRWRSGFWYQNYETSDQWDEVLNIALDRFGITGLDTHTVNVGPFEVWVANWPSAFGYNRNAYPEVLPRVATRIRLRDMVLAARFAYYGEIMEGWTG